MIKLLHSNTSAAKNRKRLSIITRLLVLLAAVWLIGCADDPVTDRMVDDDEANMGNPTGNVAIVNSDDQPDSSDGEPDTENVFGRIVIHQTGGFAGVSKVISIGEENGSLLLVSVDQSASKRRESPISTEDLNCLWEKLEANDVFTLPTNLKMLDDVRDAFLFELTVQKGEKHNQFSVYAPDLLVGIGEKRYNAILQAINGFTDSQLQVEEFIVDEMPVNDVSIQILESFPLQVHITFNGFLRDGCTSLSEITQRRDGNTILVHITTKRPEDAICIQVIEEIALRVPLEGAFLPGRYTVVVNDFRKEFEIPGGADFQKESGIIKGKVTIGPLCPVEPCNLPPEDIARIYEARKVIIYQQATKTRAAQANLDRDGKYSISLWPGCYIVDISDAQGNALPLDLNRRPRIGNIIPVEVQVKPGEEIVMDFDIDTGIR